MGGHPRFHCSTIPQFRCSSDFNSSMNFHETFITQHMHDANNIIKKPLILEEYGKLGSDAIKVPYLRSANQLVEGSARKGGALRGSLFFHWYPDGVGPGRFGIHTNGIGATKTGSFQEIERHAREMSNADTCAWN